MPVFRQQDNRLIWELKQQIVQIEPWGRDSLRVRATIGLAVNTGLPQALLDPPPFEETVIEDRGNREVVQQTDGARVLRNKVAASIPMHVGHLLVDRDSWNEHYKPRLDPASPGRYPDNWDEIEQEVLRLTRFVEEGGFIGFCDHRVPPTVPLENYMFYLEKVREVWGQNIDLEPIGELTE